MILYPAIDILDGQAVRLVQGRFEDKTVYDDDPLEAARSWVDAGAPLQKELRLVREAGSWRIVEEKVVEVK